MMSEALVFRLEFPTSPVRIDGGDVSNLRQELVPVMTRVRDANSTGESEALLHV
ncbi:MAG: hypothetical protein MK082_02580 [Phycisphaerales bacterium]|nr:hypothetical protein [Phycisphaerales bacterium]